MEQTQLLNWDEALLDSDSPDNTEGSQEPVGKLHLCSGPHGPERDYWIHLGENLIGRHENCHVPLPAQSVSKKHAVIEAEAESHTIFDCGSLNKTRRRKAVLKPHIRYALEDGDLLLFADVACQYFILPPPSSETGGGTRSQDTAGHAQASPQAAALETPEEFDSDDESVLVPATQLGAAKSLVFEKTPAAGRMGYGGVLAKDSDEDADGGENTINPTGRSRGSEESTSSRGARDRSTSAALHSPSTSTVIPESDEECGDLSTASARFPSLHLQYDSNTEADDSLANPDSVAKVRLGATAPPKAARPSPKSTVETLVGGDGVGQGSGVAGETPAQYHLDSDTDVEEEEPEAGNSGPTEQSRAGATEHRLAQFHVDSDTDVEEDESAAASRGDPTPGKGGGTPGIRKSGPPVQVAAAFNLDSETDVEEDADTLEKVAVRTDINLGSDTDVEEEPTSAGKATGSSRSAAKQDSDTDVEAQTMSAGNAVERQKSSKPREEQDSDTDVEEPSSAGKTTAQKNCAKLVDQQDSDTDVDEEVVSTSRKSLRKTGTKEHRNASGRDRAAADAVSVQDDEDTDVEEAAECRKTAKAESDEEADDGLCMALLATQCYVADVPGAKEEAEDVNSSAESGDEGEATQAFVFKSPPVKPVPYKKLPLPSPGGSALHLPVCTSSEKEEFSDDEGFAVAETQSFCRGPDLSAIDLEDEPTQAFLVEGRTGLRGPPTSTQKISSVKGLVNAHMQARRSSVGEKEHEEKTLAEEETQLFYTGNTATATTRVVEPSEDPSQDETQPIALYLGLAVGHSTPSETRPSGPFQRVSQPLPIHTGREGLQTPIGQKIMTEDPPRVSDHSLLESEQLNRRPVQDSRSEEATQSLSLHLCLSEEPTQAYTIDVSETLPEPGSEAFDTEPVLPTSFLGDVAETNNSSRVVVHEGAVDWPTGERDDATQLLESSTPGRKASGQPSLAYGTVTRPNSSPWVDEASEPGPSEVGAGVPVGKAVVSGGEPEAEPPGIVEEKKRPALSKRGRKKKADAEEEHETAAKTAAPPAEPAAERDTAELPDIKPEAKEDPPTARGRQSRRNTATSSTPAINRHGNEATSENLKGQEAEALRETADLKGARKGRLGRGLSKKSAVEEPESQTGVETDAVTGPSTKSPALATVTKDGRTADVGEMAATHFPTLEVEAAGNTGLLATNAEAVATKDGPTADVEAAITDPPTADVGAASTNPPNVEVVPTPGDWESQAATARRRGGRRGQATVVVSTEPPLEEPTLTPVEQDRRGNRNRRKQSVILVEAESRQEPESEPAPSRGRGRLKKAVSSDVTEKQQDSEVAQVEPSTPARASRARKASTGAGLEEELRPTAAVSGRLKRGALVKKEEEDQPMTSEGGQRANKLSSVGTTKIIVLELPPEACVEEEAAIEPTSEQPSQAKLELPPEVRVEEEVAAEPTPEQPPEAKAAACVEEEAATEPTPEQPPQAKVESVRPRSRHGRDTCPSDPPAATQEQVVTSDQASSPVMEQTATDNQVTAPTLEQAVTNDLAGAPGVEQAVTCNLAESSAAARAPRKRATMSNGEQVAKGGAPTAAPPRTSRKKGAVEAEEAAAEVRALASVAPRTPRKRGVAEAGEEMAEVKAPAAAPRASRKRGTAEAGEKDVVAKSRHTTTAPGASRKRGTAEDEREPVAEAGAPITTDSRAMRKRTTEVGEETAEAEAAAEAPKASRKSRSAEAGEEAPGAVTAAPQASSNRGGEEVAVEVGAPIAASRASSKRGTAEAGEGETRAEARALAATPRASRKRGTTQAGEEAPTEASNVNQTGIAEQKKRRTSAASSEGTAADAGEESSSERGLGNTAELGQRREHLGKEASEASNTEQMGSAEQKQRRASAASNEGIAGTASEASSQSERGLENPSKETGGRRRKQAGKAAEPSNALQTASVDQKRRRTSTAANEGAVATEAATATNNHQIAIGLETTAGGRRRRQAGKDDAGKVSNIDQEGSTEQKGTVTASNEGAAAATTSEANSSLSERALESSAAKAGRPRKKQAASSKTSEEGSQAEAGQVEAPQSRGKGSQQRKSTIIAEAKDHEEDQATALKAAEDSQSLPSQEEPHSRAASRSNSRGRKQAQQTDSSQESQAPGRRGRKPSSASSEDRAEDTSTPPDAHTPRRMGRAPVLGSSPAVIGECGSPKVMFTGVIDETGEKVVQRLGGELADSVYECTHLVTDRIRRTVKFLCAVARGIPIVTLDWLEKCGKNKSFLSPSSFLVKDREQELNFNFRLSESLHKARKQCLFEGYEIHVTPSVKPEPEHMKDIIQCSGATFLPKMPREYKDKRVIVSCSTDLAKCKPALSASLPITSSEFILTGILQQIADLDAFRLEGTAPAAEGAGKPRGGKRAANGAGPTCSTLPPSTATTKRRR